MRGTSILLSDSLWNRADHSARQLGISFGELVRRALIAHLEESRGVAVRDPFFADGAVYSGPLPGRAAVRHDEDLHPKRRP